jgi:hypothetical protein
MIDRLIEVSLRNRFLVIAFFILVAGWGYWALLTTPIDAIPDLSDNQVIVFTDWTGRSPQEVEDQVTYPLTVSLQGLPGVRVVRSSSAFGFSMINVIFEDDQLQPRVGTQAMQKLVTIDKVPVVIGSISSSVTLAIAPIAEKNQVVLISPASTSHDITTAGDFIFRTIPSDIYEGAFMARFAYNQRKFHRVAILAVNAAGTKGMSDAFKDTFSGLRGDILLYELVDQGASDFRAVISKAIAVQPEAQLLTPSRKSTWQTLRRLSADYSATCLMFPLKITDGSGGSSSDRSIPLPPDFWLPNRGIHG